MFLCFLEESGELSPWTLQVRIISAGCVGHPGSRRRGFEAVPWNCWELKSFLISHTQSVGTGRVLAALGGVCTFPDSHLGVPEPGENLSPHRLCVAQLRFSADVYTSQQAVVLPACLGLTFPMF